MKKVLIICVMILGLFVTQSDAKQWVYPATSLTGGGTGALDAIDGQNLQEGDTARVTTSSGTWDYYLDADANLTESSPRVISPDTNAGTKRWILVRDPSKYYVNPGASDQGADGNDYSLLDLATTIGTTKKATVILPHTSSGTTTQFLVSTALNLASYSNISFLIENGAQLKVSAGVSGVTLPSSDNVSTQPNQHIVSGASLFFSSGGERVYSSWWGTTVEAVNEAILQASRAGIGEVVLPEGTLEYASGILLKNGVTLKGTAKMQQGSTKGTIIKPTNAAPYAIYSEEGTMKGWGLENVLVDMTNMASGTTGIYIQGVAWNGNLKNISVKAIPQYGAGIFFFPTTTGGVYWNTFQDIDITGTSPYGVGIKTSRETGSTSRFNANTFLNVRNNACNQGWVMDATGSGNLYINCGNEGSAGDGVTFTNVSSGSAPQWWGGEISSNDGYGVNGVCMLNGTTFSSNTSGNMTNGASLLDMDTGVTVTANRLTWDGEFKASLNFISGVSATQTLSSGSTIYATYGIVPVASSGGPVPLTNDVVISDGASGQFLLLRGTSNTNYPIIKDNTGARLIGDWHGKLDSTLLLYYSASATDWVEISRSPVAELSGVTVQSGQTVFFAPSSGIRTALWESAGTLYMTNESGITGISISPVGVRVFDSSGTTKLTR